MMWDDSSRTVLKPSTTKVLQESYRSYEAQIHALKDQRVWDEKLMQLLEDDLLNLYHTLKKEQNHGNIQKRTANTLIQLLIHIQRVLHRDPTLLDCTPDNPPPMWEKD